MVNDLIEQPFGKDDTHIHFLTLGSRAGADVYTGQLAQTAQITHQSGRKTGGGRQYGYTRRILKRHNEENQNHQQNAVYNTDINIQFQVFVDET
jgi:hypothetical protein